MNENEGESCPGADDCRDNKGPLWRYRGREEEEICGGCPLVKTKFAAVPGHLQPFVNLALELTELTRAGATFHYPDAASPWEWAALTGLQRGRDRAEALKAERDRKQHRLDEAKKRFGRR